MSPFKTKSRRLRLLLLSSALLAAWLAPVADASACYVLRYTLKGVHADPSASACGASPIVGAAGASSVTTTIPGQTTTVTASAAGAPVITYDSDYPGALHMPAGNSSACYDVPWYLTNLYANGAVIYTDTSSTSSKPLDTAAEAGYSFAWSSSWDTLGAYSYSASTWTWYTPTSSVVWDPNTAVLTGDPTGGQLAGRSAADTYYDPLFCGSTSTSVTVTVTDKKTGLSGSLTFSKAIVTP